MRRGARSAVSRLAGDLRLAAADRYREAVAERSSEVRLYLAAAAGYDRLAGIKRAVSGSGPSGTRIADSAVALTRRLRHGDTLLLQQAAIGGSAELSLSLSGPAPACAAACEVALVPTAGGSARVLPTVRSVDGDSVRLAAQLDPDPFAAEHGAWHVLVRGTAGELPVVIASRTALPRRWSTKVTWPPRLDVDAERRLVVSGRRPARAGLPHDITAGLTSAIVTWPGDVAQLRFTARSGQGAFLVEGHQVAGGTCTATVDLLAVAARAPAIWDASARDGRAGWLPLQLAPGQYPPMSEAVAVTLRVSGRSVDVYLAYSERNRLGLHVRDRR